MTTTIGDELDKRRVGKPKGLPKSGGRVKGTPNKLTAQVKEMILKALDEAGGVEYLVEQARLSPSAFLALVGKVLPLQVNADVSAASVTRIEIVAVEPGGDSSG